MTLGAWLEQRPLSVRRAGWGVAHRLLSEVPLGDLTCADLDRLAVAAYLTGRDGPAASAWEAAYRKHADAGDGAEAARCAFWLGLALFAGKTAPAGGWLGRAHRIVKEGRSSARPAAA